MRTVTLLSEISLGTLVVATRYAKGHRRALWSREKPETYSFSSRRTLSSNADRREVTCTLVIRFSFSQTARVHKINSFSSLYQITYCFTPPGFYFKLIFNQLNPPNHSGERKMKNFSLSDTRSARRGHRRDGDRFDPLEFPRIRQNLLRVF